MMLNYIFKSTSGSFFRTIGRILAYGLLAILIAYFSGYINISNVSALTISEQFTLPNNKTIWYNAPSNDHFTQVSSSYFDENDGEPHYTALKTINTIPNSSGAAMMNYFGQPFMKDNYYTVSFLLTAESGGNFAEVTPATTNNAKICVARSYSAQWSSCPSADMRYSAFKINVGTEIYTGYVLSYTFKSPVSGQVVSNTFTTGTTGNYWFTFYGYTLTDHGSKAPTTDDIKNALQSNFNQINSSINNSTSTINKNINNATNSINNNVDNATNSINNNIDEMKAKQEETNDYLKDDTPPDSDISSLGNVQGLLPPGPVDSLLNIPFKFLSILTSSMGGVCTPVKGKFVFDSELTLPCFSEVIWDNDSVPADLLNWLSLIPSAFILIKYFKHLYKKVDRAVSMETTSDDEWGVI